MGNKKFTENSNTSLESTYISDADMYAAMGSWKGKRILMVKTYLSIQGDIR